MLIESGCRLGAAVAVSVAEIERANAVLAESAREGRTAIQWLSRVISHVFDCNPFHCFNVLPTDAQP